jgi:hypothetical protein
MTFKYAAVAAVMPIVAVGIDLVRLAFTRYTPLTPASLSFPMIVAVMSFLLPSSALLALLGANSVATYEERKSVWLVAAIALIALLTAVIHGVVVLNSIHYGML